jgi:(p)ppGpp synthase/HD superfamily hydrolase
VRRGGEPHRARRVSRSRFQEALLFAVRIHDGDLRKGTSIPYVSHPLSVCALVLEDDGDEEEAIAALRHDTLEDHPEQVTESDLARRFGTRVADLVVQCSDTPPEYRGGP